MFSRGVRPLFYIGADIGGTKIAVGLVDENGKILIQNDVPTGVGRHYSEIIKDMALLIQKVVRESELDLEDIKAIGVGSPGAVSNSTGMVIFANNLYWHNVPLRQELQKYIDKPVYIENDANVAAFAEAMCGACQGVDASVTMTLGTGLGAGIVINGKPYPGSHGVGAELGHIVIEPDGLECTCGNRGCLERYTSATALIREGKEVVLNSPDSLIFQFAHGDPERITAKIVIDAAKEGDSSANTIMNRYVHYLALGIVNVINFIDPDIIAIGGGVSKAGDFLLDALKKEVGKKVLYKAVPYAKICLARMGNEAGIVGAAMLGKHS